MKRITFSMFLVAMVAGLFLVAGCVAPPEVDDDMMEKPAMMDEGLNIVEIMNDGFNPQTLNIKKGDMVIFVNKDSVSHWPASATHPLHTVYPGSGIHKCNSPDQAMIFDACRRLPSGAEYSFTFNEVGTWNYHDHTRPALTGTVVVE